MSFDVIFFLIISICVLIVIILFNAQTLIRKNILSREVNDIRELVAVRRVLIFLIALSLAMYFAFPLLEENKLSGHFLEWGNLVVRWAHVVFGIAWIGASFYFIFLENSLNRTKDLREGLAGNLWAIHGGGFYYVEKYKNAPPKIPEHLHWFKYEAYFTWLTGMLLLTLVYYMNARSFMVDSTVSDISPATAVLIGLGSLVFGWVIYDLLCRTPLFKKPKLFGLAGLIIIIFISYILSRFLSGRAAFMHVGALLGTIMAGNVFFVIIPSQKALVHAARNNLPVDPTKGTNAGLRSLHNNYITLPVIFVMISNHFPQTFASSYNWIFLSVLTIASVAVRHYINLYEKGKRFTWLLVFAAIGIFSLVFVTSPKKKEESEPVSFAEINSIIGTRCRSCHSAHPTDSIQTTAPNGIAFDTREEIEKMKEKILFRAVETKTMPQGNKTGMTEEERALLTRWFR